MEAVELQRAVAALGVALGSKKQLSAAARWRRWVILVKRRLRRGVTFDPSEPMEGMVATWAAERLVPHNAQLRQLRTHLSRTLQTRREQFEAARRQWIQVGG